MHVSKPLCAIVWPAQLNVRWMQQHVPFEEKASLLPLALSRAAWPTALPPRLATLPGVPDSYRALPTWRTLLLPLSA